MNPIVATAGRLLGWTVVAACALLFLAVGVGPLTGRYLPYTVLTASMTPTIPAGSVAFVVPAEGAELEVGDVITYRIPVQDRRVVTHRIVEVIEAGPEPTVVTRGDANGTRDAWSVELPAGSAHRVAASVPYLGYVLRGLQDPVARRLSTTVLPALTAAVWLAQIWTAPRTAPGRGTGPAPRTTLAPRWSARTAPPQRPAGAFASFTATSVPVGV